MADSTVDLDLWKVMINGNCFRNLVDNTASAVLVVGPMGAGKSTTIGIQTGAKYEAAKEEVDGRLKKVYRCVQADNRRPQTADGYTSKTLNIGLYDAEEKYGGYTYLDTAGLNEDRTGTHRVWTQWSLATSFSLLPMIKSVILVMDFRTLVTERGHGLRQMAKSLAPITGSGQASKHFYESMIFLFTNAYEDGEKVEAKSIISIAKSQLAEQQKQFRARHRDDAVQTIADDPDFDENNALMTFLQTLSEADGRIHVCFPDTPKESEKQCVAVQKMIAKSKAITKTMLREIVATRPTGNLEVLQTFAKIAAGPDSRLEGKSYTDLLRQRSDLLQKLVHLAEEQKERLQAIESDWQWVQRDMLSGLRAEKDGLSQQKSYAQKRINQLKISESPTVIEKREVKKSYPTSGWWVLFMVGGGWGWGKQSAHDTLAYEGAWFSTCDFSGADYTKQVRECDEKKGVLKVDFTSTEGVDLNVTVRFYRPEKDTEETKQLIASLQRQIDDLTKQMKDCDTKMYAVTAANSQEKLVNLVFKEKEALETADGDLFDMLQQAAAQPTPDFPKAPCHLSIMTMLQGVLSVLKEREMLPPDLAQSTRESIDAFLDAWDKVQKHQRELSRGPARNFIAKQVPVAEHQTEDAPPVKPSFRARARGLLCAADSPGKKALLVCEELMRQPVALAVALCTYAILLKLWPSSTLQGALGNFFFAVSVHLFARKLCTDGLHAAALTADDVGHRVGSLQQWVEGRLEQAGEATSEMTQGLGDQLVTGLKDAVRNLDLKSFAKNLDLRSLVKIF